jgi:hypothetical protein
MSRIAIAILIYLHHKPVTLVRERTIPTERPPLVGEISANFCHKPIDNIKLLGS